MRINQKGGIDCDVEEEKKRSEPYFGILRLSAYLHIRELNIDARRASCKSHHILNSFETKLLEYSVWIIHGLPIHDVVYIALTEKPPIPVGALSKCKG